jgi:hypothetical protein
MNRDSEKPLRLFVNPFAAWTGLAFKTGEMLLAATQMAVSGAAAGRVAPVAENDHAPRPAPPQSAKASKRVASKPASSARTSANRKRKKRAR